MKSCPTCGNQYSDETLRFCLQDGSLLTGATQADTPTVVLGETETVAARRDYGRVDVPIVEPGSGQWQESRVTQLAAAPKRGSAAKLIVGVFGVLLLLALGVVGVSLILLYANRPAPPDNSGNNPNIAVSNIALNANSFETPTPSKTFGSPTPVPSVAPTNAANTLRPPSNVQNEQVRTEVTQRIYDWKSLTESKNMNALAGSYAGTLDYYYTRRNVSVSTVVADKRRAFREFSSIRINISNINITPDASGETATVIYNKDWAFDGTKPWSGMVRSQMQLRKINGTWLITGEKDIPGTYKRTR